MGICVVILREEEMMANKKESSDSSACNSTSNRSSIKEIYHCILFKLVYFSVKNKSEPLDAYPSKNKHSFKEVNNK
jgi:hypothetical protein